MINLVELKYAVSFSLLERSVCHGYVHAENVETIAIKLASSYPEANKDVIRAISLLHDVWDHKFVDGADAIKEQYIQLLLKAGYTPADTTNIINAIDDLSWSKGSTPTSIEGKIVQDADRITAIGAVGVLRAATYAAQHHAPLSTTIDHLVDKCLLLKDSLNLPESRSLATARHELLVKFIAAYKSEVETAHDDQ